MRQEESRGKEAEGQDGTTSQGAKHSEEGVARKVVKESSQLRTTEGRDSRQEIGP